MTSEQVAEAVIDALEGLGIPYMLVGSFSSNLYGIPRSTKDIDLVIELGSQSVRTIADRLGPQFCLDSQMSFESVTMTSQHVIEVIGSPFKIELFHLSDDPHDRERFRRRRRATFGQRSVSVATAEDVIITKLNWAVRSSRGKDREDVRDVIAVQGGVLDWDYIYSWADRHGTRELLEDIRRSIPPL